MRTIILYVSCSNSNNPVWRGLNRYAFSSDKSPAAPAFQAARLPVKVVGIAQVHPPFEKTRGGWGVYWYSNKHALRNTKERNMRSKIRWFTEFCNSHYVSHFAAFFIDARAKRSVVESCIDCVWPQNVRHSTHASMGRFCRNVKPPFSGKRRVPRGDAQRGEMDCERALRACTSLRTATARAPPLYNNDPSAGSPTETLLRLLLPLNDQVWPTFQQRGVVADSPKPIRRSH